MRRLLFPSLVILLIAATALLAWLWWSDALLVDQCLDAGGRWNRDTRVCEISADRPLPASLRG